MRMLATLITVLALAVPVSATVFAPADQAITDLQNRMTTQENKVPVPGPAGPTGATGATGATGPMGPAGPAGGTTTPPPPPPPPPPPATGCTLSATTCQTVQINEVEVGNIAVRGSESATANHFGLPNDTNTAPTASTLQLFECYQDGHCLTLGPAHSAYNDVQDAAKGRGRYSHWGSNATNNSLYFSASDNSNPSTNGRTYRFIPSGSPVSTLPPPVTPPVAGGAAVCAKIACPTLVNARTLIPSGGDDAAQIQGAITAGSDVMLTGGNFKVDLKSILINRSNVHIRCAPGSGITNMNPAITNGPYSGAFVFQGSGNSTASVIGCIVRQSNTVPPSFVQSQDGPGHYNFMGNIQEYANVLWAGNSLFGCVGQACVQTYCPTSGCPGAKFLYNTVDGAGLYAFALTASTDGEIAYNLTWDGEIGVEVDLPGQPSGRNLIHDNEVRSKYGVNSPRDTDKATLLTCGSSNKAINYTTNKCYRNAVYGLATKKAALLTGSVLQADYSGGNLCTAGTNCGCWTGIDNVNSCAANGPGPNGPVGAP